MSDYILGRIPRPHPWSDCRGLHQIPSLSDNERSTMKSTLPNLVQECLNPQVTMSHQDAEDVEFFTSRAIEEMPFLDRYHEAWPAIVYVRESLYVRKRAPNTSNDPTTNYRTAIPRTSGWHAYRNICSIPGLSPEERAALRSTVQARAPYHLDMRMTWTNQTEASRQEFLKDVTSKLAFLSRYDGGWPAEAHAKAWISRKVDQQKIAKNKARAKSPSVEIIEKPSSSQPWTRATAREQRQRMRSMRSQMQGACGASSSAGATSSAGSRTPLDTFLASIHPCMSSLGPILVEGGIIDLDHLDGLAELPWEEKDEFFKTDLGLSLFQTRMLKRGLEDRAERA